MSGKVDSADRSTNQYAPCVDSRSNYKQAPEPLARKDSACAELKEARATRSHRLSKSVRGIAAVGYAKIAAVFSLISAEAYGVWSSGWGPLAVQKWGPATDYTINPGQTIAVDNGSCNVGYINQFGSQFNFDIIGDNGNGSSTSFFNISPGQHIIEFGRSSGLCNDPIKVTLLSKAANGAVNIAVQTSQSWGVQQIVAYTTLYALAFTAALASYSVYKYLRR